MTVASNWTVAPYSKDFKDVVTMPSNNGNPLDVSFSTGNTLWVNSEFSSAALGENTYQRPNRSSSTSQLTELPDPYNSSSTPFVQCFFGPCSSTSNSALGERVIYADKKIWATEGGWFGYIGSLQNHSEVVAYNPATGGFCTYLVPGNNNEIIGIAATGTGRNTTIWFDQASPQQLDSFSPYQVGSSCPGTYNLSGARSFREFALPKLNANSESNFPAQIAVDPGGSRIWVTQIFGSEIDEVNTSTGAVSAHPYPSQNLYSSTLGQAFPWQVVADAGYVYAIDYGDDRLVRLEKSGPNPGHIDEAPIPLTSDGEKGYGLTLSGGRLYFTLADDGPPSFGAASTFGYVDVSTWENSSNGCSLGVDCAPAPVTAVVYAGLSAVADPSSAPDFRGIAASATGQITIADLTQVIRLVPN